MILLRTLSLFLILVGGTASAWAAFPIPERLVFDISWTGITAGTAVQEVTRTGDVITITQVAKSANWLSTFFEVDDHIEAVMSKGDGSRLFGMPLIYRENLREGSTRFHKDVTFDHVKRIAHITDFLHNTKTSLDITPITFDSLSSFYFARLQNMEPGTSFFVDVFDGKKLHKTEVKVLRREKLETAVGTFNSVVIMPVLMTQGVFSKTGDLFIWLSDDEHRIPLKMKSKVKIGSITASLVGGSYWPEKK